MGSRHARPGGPIRICFPFVGDRLGGSHISALKLVQALDRHSFEPRVVLHQDGGRLAEFLRGEGIGYEVLALPSLPSARTLSAAGAALHLARVVPRIRAFLAAHGFDVVHSNDAQTHAAWGLAARLAGARLVWHHRGDPDARGANFLAPAIADHMITVSNFARPNRPALSMDRRVSVIHSPFERPPVVPDRTSEAAMLRAELGVPADTRILGYFGNLVERKRPLLFVDVVDRVRRAMPDIPVVGCLFGISLPGRADLVTAARQRAEKLGVSDHVRLMGFRQPVEPYMAATDILLVPAVGEPFGRGLIEAMFLGTPVVATAHGGNVEAIEDGRTGFLVPPDDADAFVPPVVALLRDGTLFDRVSRAAREQALLAYGVERHVTEVETVYRALRLRARPAAAPRLAGETLS